MELSIFKAYRATTRADGFKLGTHAAHKRACERCAASFRRSLLVGPARRSMVAKVLNLARADAGAALRALFEHLNWLCVLASTCPLVAFRGQQTSGPLLGCGAADVIY